MDDERFPLLVKRGLMKTGHAINDGTMRYYYVTEAGAAAVGSTLPEESTS